MYILQEIRVINELTTFPEFVSNFKVVNTLTGDIALTTTSEEKASSLAFRLNGIANLRDL